MSFLPAVIGLSIAEPERQRMSRGSKSLGWFPTTLPQQTVRSGTRNNKLSEFGPFIFPMKKKTTNGGHTKHTPGYSHSTQFNVVQFQICMVNPSILGGSMVQPPKFEPWRFLSGPGFRRSGVPRTFIHMDGIYPAIKGYPMKTIVGL